MVYKLLEIKIPKTKRTKLEVKDLNDTTGFVMSTRRKSFNIENMSVENLNIINKKLAHPLAYKKVDKLYTKLITLLTELLVTDDDSGESYREALNQIERFRIQIKNKYREYLTRKELEKMSKQLKLLQMEAKNRFMELQSSYELYNTTGKSR